MKKLKTFLNSFLFLFLFALCLTPFAYADLDLSSVSVDVTPVFQLAGIIVGAIASIWAVKKVIKLANRS